MLKTIACLTAALLASPLHAAQIHGASTFAVRLTPGMPAAQVAAALKLEPGSPTLSHQLLQQSPALALRTDHGVVLVPLVDGAASQQAVFIDARSGAAAESLALPKALADALTVQLAAGGVGQAAHILSSAFDGAALQPEDAVVVPEQLVADGLPQLPRSLAKAVGPYLEMRGAYFNSWHPTKRQMLILTRFADSMQVHALKTPGGDRRQVTFFKDPVAGADYEPTEGKYLVYTQDTGGAESFQLYRLDLETGKTVLLTDGKSRNSGGAWARSGRFIAYTSTRRNGADNDLYVMDPADPSSARLVAETSGGGWGISAVSPDEKTLLVENYVSANESQIHLFDVKTGARTPLLPAAGERVSYSNAKFSRDGRSIFAVSNRGSDVGRLVRVDVKSKKEALVVAPSKWEVESFVLSPDGRKLAYLTNEDGSSVLRVVDAGTGAEIFKPKLALGVISDLRWHANSSDLAFTFSTARASSDVYSLDVKKLKIRRWTRSETGGLNAANFREPELVRVKSFDGEVISGFLYRPDPKRFPGKRPVAVNLHGGPEGQSRPGFQGRGNYYMDEMGIAMFYPNVRGSTGYGSRFLDLDNGYKREDSVKDMGAILDWIKQDPALDGSRVAVMGGSYGGYMTLASLVHYSDRLVGGIDVVGISDFVTFLENTSSYRRDLRRVEYGDERDPQMRAFLKSISPLTNVDKIRRPLFVVQGLNDPRVPVGEAEQIVKAVRDKGREAWYLLGKNEGHGFARKPNVDFLFLAVISFMARYLLGPGSEA